MTEEHKVLEVKQEIYKTLLEIVSQKEKENPDIHIDITYVAFIENKGSDHIVFDCHWKDTQKAIVSVQVLWKELTSLCPECTHKKYQDKEVTR